MSLPDDLLAQAEYLLRHEPRRPKQATLRRAVSAAYYALFHLLTDASARYLITGQTPAGLRETVQRAYDHGAMRQACRSFASGALPAHLAPLVAGGLPPDLRSVAAAFVLLQEARHEADYDLTRRYTRREAADLIALARKAAGEWEAVKALPEARLFLVALLIWKQWGRG